MIGIAIDNLFYSSKCEAFKVTQINFEEIGSLCVENGFSAITVGHCNN
jgi:hypothetical protein